MKIKLLTGDLKVEEDSLQLPADTIKYAGRDNKSIESFNAAPHGTPIGSTQYRVDASYDSRPVNGIDFNAVFVPLDPNGFPFPGYFTVDSTNYGTEKQVTLDGIVTPYPGSNEGTPYTPAGYVFVVKALSAQVTTYSKGSYLYTKAASVSVLVNDQPVPAGSNISIDWADDDIPLFFIIDESTKTTIDLRFKMYYQPTSTIVCTARVTLYGNLLPKTGTSKQFEIATPIPVK